jgi:signal transduction histidine kinase
MRPETDRAETDGERSEDRILVVDDNSDMRDYLYRLLRERWVVESVSNGALALEAARTRRPAVIVTDVMMPELDGFGLLRAVRADPELRRIPVIMLSARAGEEAQLEGLDAGADDYLVKPFSARELLARVGSQLALARTRREVEKEREARIEGAEQTLEFGENFVRVLGHELRNPLGSISAAADLLLKRGSDERITRPIQRIRASADRMSLLVDQLLDFTRVRIGGGIPIDPTAVDLKEVVVTLVEELQAAASQEILLQASGDTGGRWDAERVQQVVATLLDNAIAHGAPSDPIRIQLDGSAPDSVRIVVWNGGNIAEPLLTNLFEPFHAATTPGKAHRSLRLGLYIMQQIVQAHSGSIDVRSLPDEGTTFVVSLPRDARERHGQSLR